ncbi:bifunctional (p)ppGpp synthetase/guanosine-3',5'-bis(diphosphate) 3'-pyrophosphohydrolase [Thermaerobacter sp. FW80]|uniref:RelA/SpoT family protein n=1 Tax=Thermaerobacter sp. FW80 TaxID=2546351 RepID=UPI0010756515|nr:bifunctional (p)ppGpp synthetase/guanosine-3',5'-bis(diphosphate) 3'-pyrophosphohydrolase [Thermaerobacter sp. FW80]QBS38010.1 bifunctional (p)ppGpp synthetase/guanosine-3',5'-bis(diphosphate) 3'-pyrophosphohydrolase [Thermaerobacter sp. FW80]
MAVELQPSITPDALLERAGRYLGAEELEWLRRAFEFSKAAHHGQKRASGQDFIEHPLAVALILADLELDAATLVAALLHDTVEDTPVTLEQVEREFGPEVALLVDGVTKLNRIEWRTRLEEQAENLRKMFLAMARDIRVVLIKLADRLHNMRTLSVVPREKQIAKSRETLEIFAPLAHRLGMSQIQCELEDLALRYLEPEHYRELAERIPRKRAEREALAQVIIATLKARLAEAGIRADIQGRAKHFYSIYRKMYEQGKDLSQIYDLIAVRVIVDTVKDCYGALGVVHTIWRPLPGRFKDYIATPKSNMYQSLHTTVIGPQGEPFEIQIRTWDMHRTAEYGIAAHWRYKERGRTDKDFDAKLAWLRQILEWQNDLGDAREFMESLKIDVFSDEVFVFTPKGDVIDLPAGSTPVDFAYRIHTEIGHHCVGAKVNGRIVPLDYRLKNGDIVEILTNKQSGGPSADWLQFVRTSTARSRIRQWLKKQRRDENLERGRLMLEHELRAHGLPVREVWRKDWLDEVAGRYNLPDGEELLVAIGYGGVAAGQVAGRLRELYRRQQARDAAEGGAAPPDPAAEDADRRGGTPAARAGVRVDGLDHVLVRFSRCCNPVPGDPIVGYVTRGRGVSIHRADCTMLKASPEADRRLIDVSWDQVAGQAFPVAVEISCYDRVGLLSDITAVVADTRRNILAARTRTHKDGTATIDLVVEVQNLEQFDQLRRQLERVRDVIRVERVASR